MPDAHASYLEYPRLPWSEEEAFRHAAEQLQQQRGGGFVPDEEIRQLLAEQFHVVSSQSCVYNLLKQFGQA